MSAGTEELSGVTLSERPSAGRGNGEEMKLFRFPQNKYIIFKRIVVVMGNILEEKLNSIYVSVT